MGGRWAVAALSAAIAVPAAAVAAVVIAGGSEAGVLELSSPSGTLGGLPQRLSASSPAARSIDGTAGQTGQAGQAGQQPGQPGSPGSGTAATGIPIGPPVPAGATGAPDHAATAAGRSDTRTLVPGARVGTTDRRLSFVAPQGWVYGLCPQGGDSCVEIAPTALGGGDAIDVLVSAEAPGDSTGADGQSEWGTSGGRLTVAGRPARQVDLRSNASVLVYGPMPEPGQRFMVSCRYDQLEKLVRQACDQVVGTLQLAA